jgi:hypothetical protein
VSQKPKREKEIASPLFTLSSFPKKLQLAVTKKYEN